MTSLALFAWPSPAAPWSSQERELAEVLGGETLSRRLRDLEEPEPHACGQEVHPTHDSVLNREVLAPPPSHGAHSIGTSSPRDFGRGADRKHKTCHNRRQHHLCRHHHYGLHERMARRSRERDEGEEEERRRRAATVATIRAVEPRYGAAQAATTAGPVRILDQDPLTVEAPTHRHVSALDAGPTTNTAARRQQPPPCGRPRERRRGHRRRRRLPCGGAQTRGGSSRNADGCHHHHHNQRSGTTAKLAAPTNSRRRSDDVSETGHQHPSTRIVVRVASGMIALPTARRRGGQGPDEATTRIDVEE